MSSFTAKATYIFFQQNIQHICVSLDVKFNESLTNDIVSFEQLGPDLETKSIVTNLSSHELTEALKINT